MLSGRAKFLSSSYLLATSCWRNKTKIKSSFTIEPMMFGGGGGWISSHEDSFHAHAGGHSDEDDDCEEEIVLMKRDETQAKTSGNGGGLNGQQTRNSDKDDDLADELERLTLKPKVVEKKDKHRTLLVLDLNGLLVYRMRPGSMTPEDKQHYQRFKNTPGGPEKLNNFITWKRPHAQSFVPFLFNDFDILVWSSAQMRNIQLMLDVTLSKEHREGLVDVFDQTSCLELGIHPNSKFKPLFIKELSKVWEKYPDLYSQENTLLIDDSLYKAVANPPHTAIHPKEWTCYMDNDDMLGPGGSLYEFLAALHEARLQGQTVPEFVASKKFDGGFAEEELEEERRIARIASERLANK